MKTVVLHSFLFLALLVPTHGRAQKRITRRIVDGIGSCAQIIAHSPAYLAAYQTLYFQKERARNGRNTEAYYEELLWSQYSEPEQLERRQVKELRKLLVHANERIPYYQRVFREYSFDPMIQSLADIQKLPILTKEIVRAEGDNLIDPASKGKNIVKSTSGSTGTPTTFEYDQNNEAWRQAARLRGWGWAGYQIGAPTFIYWAGAVQKPSTKEHLKKTLDRTLKGEFYFDSLRRDELAFQQAVDAIRAFKPTSIVCLTQSCAALAQWITDNNKRDWDDIPVIGGGEAMLPRDREAIAAAFGPGVYETYGSREVMLMAAECPTHKGMHISEERVLLELVQPEDTSKAVDAGQSGAVLVTDLQNYAMPLIRYENGDAAVRMPDGRTCKCGRTLDRLERIDGRRVENLRAKDGTPVPGLSFHQVFLGIPRNVVNNFQVIQKKDRNITVKIVRGPKFSQPALDAAINLVHHKYFSGLEIAVEFVDEIPVRQNSGKQQTVIIE